MNFPTGAIITVDGHYEREGLAAVYFLISGGRAAIIETAANSSLPYVLAALRAEGVAKEAVDYVCVSHVHLDHAGGAGSYMREFTNAKLIVHPRGARHMENPEKLVEGVKAVYGASETERLYGEILPVPKERITAARDGEAFALGGMTLECHDTPGHAKHHMIFFEKSTKSLFSGDAFGMCYEWQTGPFGRWAFPTSSPVQFDPDAMTESVKKIVSLSPERIFLTHYGEIKNIEQNARNLIKAVKKYTEIAAEERGEKEAIKTRLAEYYKTIARENKTQTGGKSIEELLPVDLELNAQGLDFWYHNQKR